MSYLSEKFCLKWNDFQQNIVSSYYDLRKDSDFCDVTLVCEEDQRIEAHRIILTACSPFFSSVLKKNKHSHPMIYMRGLKAKDLVAIVDFIYHGEANIYEEDLDGFLIIAEELQLKGLAGTQDKTPTAFQEQIKKPNHIKPNQKTVPLQELPMFKESDITAIDTFEVEAGKLLVPLDTGNEDLKAQLDSMMEKSLDGDIKYSCTTCGKQSKGKNWGMARKDMRQNIETHIEGLSYPCNQCGKISR